MKELGEIIALELGETTREKDADVEACSGYKTFYNVANVLQSSFRRHSRNKRPAKTQKDIWGYDI